MVTKERSLTRWGPKSEDFLNWQNLATDGKIRVVETDASRNDGWSYHLCATGEVVSGVWDTQYHAAEGWASNSDFINF